MQEISVYDKNDELINNLVQWDKDVYIYIKEDGIKGAYPLHFFNLESDSAYVVHSTFSNNTLMAKIPNVLLRSAITIVGYVYEEGDPEQKSIYRFKIPIRAKPMPSNYAVEGTKDYINIEQVLAECKEWAKTAESWAVGGTGTRTGEDTNNSKYYSQQSKSSSNTASTKASEAAASASAAKTSETNAKTSETNSKASETAAKTSETNAASSKTAAANSATTAANSASTASTKATEASNSASMASTKATEAANSASAAKTSETNAKTSETNAKNSETNAKTSETNAASSKTAAKTSETNAASSASTASSKATEAINSATESKSYATGGTGTRTNENIDNAKYYYEQSKSLVESFSGALRPKGTVAFANLPALSDASEGDMYNISNQFTTTANFKEGAGNVIPAGANVYKTADGKWDVLAGSPVTGVKGDAETSYRKGNVNITPENIGAAASNHTHSAATQSAAGLMSADDKKKLDGIASGAQVNTDTKVTQTNTTTSADYRVILSANANDTTETNTARKSAKFLANPSTGEFYAAGYRRIDITGQTLDIDTLNLSAGIPNIVYYINKTDGGAANITNIPVAGKPFLLDVEVIRWASASDYVTRQTFRNANNPANEYVRFCTKGTWGSWTTRVFTNTTYSNMTAATASAAGKAGLVPAPAAGAQGKYLRGDGTWQTPPDTNTTYSLATASANGLLSAHDKTWIDGKLCRRYIYGSNSNDTTHNGWYKICSVTTTATYRSYGVTLKVQSDDFINFGYASITFRLIFDTLAAGAVPTVYVYSDGSILNNIYSMWNYMYVKYNSTAPSSGGTCTIYFNKTAAYQKITVDVLDETIRGSTASTSNYQNVWTFDTSNSFVASVDETGFQVVKLNTLFADTSVGSNVQPIYINKGKPTIVNGLTSNLVTSNYLNGNKGTNVIINSTAAAGSYVMLDKLNSTNGYFTDGVYQGKRLLQYTAKSTVDAGTNGVTKSVTLLDESGNSSFPGTVTASSFSGNASSATQVYATSTAAPASVTAYYIPAYTSTASGNKSLLTIPAVHLNHQIGTTTSEGQARLILGNNIATGTAGNQTGALTMYGNNAHLSVFRPYNTSADQTRYLVGTSSAAAVGSSTKPVYISDTGTITAISSYEGNAGSATKLQTARSINGTSFNGSADITTTKWGTARTITIGGDVSGSTNIDGSANATINVVRKGCSVGTTGTPTEPYYGYKFASLTNGSINSDFYISFHVHKTYGTKSARTGGILSAHVRTNASGQWSYGELIWEYATADIILSDFAMTYNTATNPVEVNLWCNCREAYSGYQFDVISQGTRTSITSASWVLYNTWGTTSTRIDQYSNKIYSTNAMHSNITISEVTLPVANGNTAVNTYITIPSGYKHYMVTCWSMSHSQVNIYNTAFLGIYSVSNTLPLGSTYASILTGDVTFGYSPSNQPGSMSTWKRCNFYISSGRLYFTTGGGVASSNSTVYPLYTGGSGTAYSDGAGFKVIFF